MVRRRRRRTRGSDAIAPMLLIGVAGLVIAPRVTHFAHQQATLLTVAGVVVVVAVIAAAGVAVWHRRRVRAREDARTLVALRQNALSPAEFEHALAALCRRDGCTSVRVVGGAGDLGADVLATAPDGRRIVLQAKRYRNSRTVGSQDVQRFGGTARTIHGADIAAVVTTAHAFTSQAQAYAARAGILLVAARQLAAWESQTGPAPWH